MVQLPNDWDAPRTRVWTQLFAAALTGTEAANVDNGHQEPLDRASTVHHAAALADLALEALEQRMES